MGSWTEKRGGKEDVTITVGFHLPYIAGYFYGICCIHGATVNHKISFCKIIIEVLSSNRKIKNGEIATDHQYENFYQ